jgi:calcineurin-like phosphoesterase family protein
MPARRVLVTFSHYPLRQPIVGRGEEHLHLHGHIHNNGYAGKDEPYTPFSAGQINLSVEQTKYRPVNLKRLLDGALSGCYAS